MEIGLWVLIMDKKDPTISKGLSTGYEDGRYEPARNYDRSELKQYSLEDPTRRDSRVNIRLSGNDMEQLHKLSLAEGIPIQSLLAGIVHKYVNGLRDDIPVSPTKELAVSDQQSHITHPVASPRCNK